MNQVFFRIKFNDIDEIDFVMFREINEVIGKIRFEGYGKILAPRYEYFNEDIVNDLGSKMYLVLHVLHGDEQGLRTLIRDEIEDLGYNYSCELAMPNFIEIFYNTVHLADPKKFEEEFKAKIIECDGIINEYSEFKNNYDSAITFRLECQMYDFDIKFNVILNFLEKNLDEKYFIEYF